MQRRDFARAAALLPFAGTLRAQTPAWPQRPVRFILSQPAGAGPDILARFVGDQLGRLWNQGVVVENKPGGQNVIGAQAAARAPADGYTFYYATTAAMVTNAFTFKSLPYDPAKDFAPVRLVGRSPFLIAAASDFPAKDLAEVFAMARAKPGTVSMGTEGPKTFSGMLAGSVAGMAGVQFNLVPYTKAPEAIQDVIAGRVQLVCLPDAALSAFLKSGQHRAAPARQTQRAGAGRDLPWLRVHRLERCVRTGGHAGRRGGAREPRPGDRAAPARGVATPGATGLAGRAEDVGGRIRRLHAR